MKSWRNVQEKKKEIKKIVFIDLGSWSWWSSQSAPTVDETELQWWWVEILKTFYLTFWLHAKPNPIGTDDWNETYPTSYRICIVLSDKSVMNAVMQTEQYKDLHKLGFAWIRLLLTHLKRSKYGPYMAFILLNMDNDIMRRVNCI